MQRGRTGRGTAKAQSRRAHFLIEGEACRCLLARARAPVALLALLVSAAAPAMQTDEVVRGIHAEQVAAAARFGIAQTDNANARLRSLHREHDGCDRFEVGANIPWERIPSAGEAGAAAAATGGPNLADAFKHLPCDGGFALWAGGSLDVGFLRPSSAIDRSDFRTPGLTFGADMRMVDGAIIGAAIGYGRHDADIDAAGSESRADAQHVMLYGTFEPNDAVDVDTVIGVGELALDARRWQPTGVEMLSGDRGGSQFFGSFGFSADLVAPNLRVAPYARYDYVRSQLDAYGERGGAAPLFDYGRWATEEDALALGVYAGLTLKLGSATVEPGLRVEQRRVRSVAFDQLQACDDGPSAIHIVCESVDSEGSLAASLIVPVRFGPAASVAFEYSYASSSDASRTESVRAHLQAPF
jgi:uncharacterized protein with beta-barrel porin domain